MRIIAHRGNINGPSSLENHPLQIKRALDEGFDVEVDIWYVDDQLWLGHDNPQYKVDLETINDDRFWCHAKNIEALEYMAKEGVRCFWHDQDDYTLTSDGWVWAYPGKQGGEKVITVMPEIIEEKYKIKGKYAGVCTDYPHKY